MFQSAMINGRPAHSRVLLLAVMLTGCRTRLIDEPTDAAPPVDDASAHRDAAAGRDAPGSCVLHELVPVALTSISFIDQPQSLWQGAAIRIAVEYPARPACDIAAPISVDVMPGDATDFVTVTARLWRSSLADAQCGPTVSARRVVVLSDRASLTNPQISVRDGAPGPAAAGSSIGSRPQGVMCRRGPSGAACLADCECDSTTSALRCVPTGDLVQIGVCAISCSEDADCLDAQPACGGATARGTCGDGPSSCAGGAECPFGQSCQKLAGGDGCRTPLTQGSPGAVCSCDADCEAGAICTHPQGDAPGTCIFPCATTADCPGRPGCSALDCSTAGVCVQNLC